jgi:hypothetical protein
LWSPSPHPCRRRRPGDAPWRRSCATDAYRSWALIAADNQASLRAFQKASFTPVCDVIHAKMANVDRVVCRPPDPEAQELLGNAE